METHEKIRMLRKVKQLSQQEMAEKLNLSPTGYSKIERGERRIDITRLEKIAEIFGMELTELLSLNERNFIYFVNENSQYCSNNYGSAEMAKEIEKLQLQLAHKDELLQQKDELLEQKDKEIKALQKIIDILDKA